MCPVGFLRWLRVCCVVLDPATTAGGAVMTSRAEGFCVTGVRYPWSSFPVACVYAEQAHSRRLRLSER